MAQISFVGSKKHLTNLELRLIAMLATVLYSLQIYCGIGPVVFVFLDWFAFPIFAFLLADGFMRSSDRFIYARRLCVFALLAEIPYNLASSGQLINADSQNVMFTLLAGYVCIYIVEYIRERYHNLVPILIAEFTMGILTAKYARILHCEQAEYGITLILLFYISLNIRYTKLFQLCAVIYTCIVTESDFSVYFFAWGREFAIPYELIILLALVLIWCYNKKRGLNKGWLKPLLYLFYPVLLAVCVGLNYLPFIHF